MNGPKVAKFLVGQVEMRARTGLYRWSPNGDVRSREGGTEGSRFV